jgi:hypothetical protein
MAELVPYKEIEVSLTTLATATAFKMQASQIIEVVGINSGADSRVYYRNGVTITYIEVQQAPAAVVTAARCILAVTDTVLGTRYLNIGRFGIIQASGSGAVFQYDDGGTSPITITVTETPASLQSSIEALIGTGGGGTVTGIVAFAGGGQASATALSYGYNEIITVATALDSVKLPIAIVGAEVTILNDGANIANIYTQTGGTINDGAANSPIPIAPGVTLVLKAITTTNWESTAQVVAAGDGTVGAPSFTFEADADTGIYRIGANNIGVTANGAKVLDIATTGLGVTGVITGTSTTDATTKDTGAIITEGGIGVEKAIFAGGTITTSDATASVSTVTGSIITAGGVGIAKELFVSTTTPFSVSATGVATITNATDATTKDTGSIITEGGIGVEKAVFAGTSITATTILTTGAGAVAAPSLVVGANDNGQYEVSATQQGFSIGNALVAGYDTNGLFADVVSEKIAATGVTVDSLLVKDGGIAPTGTTATAGVLYSGTISVSGAGTPQTLNTLVGTVTMTGVGDIAADASETVIINNSLVTGASIGLVALQTTTAAAGSTPRIESVAYGAGTITIVIRNSDPATATGASNYTFSFILFKL